MLSRKKPFLAISEIMLLLDNYIHSCEIVEQISCNNTGLTLRRPNFPEEISENIVCHIIKGLYGGDVKWKKMMGEGGDSSVDGVTVEVKCFSGTGPSSFGASERWNKLYFLDATKYKEKIFTCYVVECNRHSYDWKNMKINNNQTYEDQANEGKRPRITFENITSELSQNENVKQIFTGTLEDIEKL